MSTLTVAQAPVVRPVPWRRLGWVVWRRYRTTLVASLVVLGLVGLYLLVTGHQIHTAYAALRACMPSHSAACQFKSTNFQNAYGSTGLLGFVQVLLPGLVGAFAGAPLLARELETGTFRYAWTQGVGRMRWAFALVVAGAVGAATVMAAFGALVAWRNRPLIEAGVAFRMDGSFFPATGPSVVGWLLAAFALGVCAGLLWRRVVPALVTAIAAWFGLAVLASLVLRAHYLAPLTTTKLQINSTNMVLAQWWTKGGVRVDDAQLNQVLQGAGIRDFTFSSGGHSHVQAAPGSQVVDPVHYLIQHGYTQITSYQPDSRFWTFQWIEFGWLTLLAIALLSATLLILRRRPA